MAKKDSFDIKEVHLKLLDDLVNVNSLLTIAVFVGLSMATPGIKSLDPREECHSGAGEAKMLILYEVIAFSCFLLSSISAKVLKLHLYLDGARYNFITRNFDLKDFMLVLSACASVAGIVSLSLSIVNIIQIRIGLLSCGCKESRIGLFSLPSKVMLLGLKLMRRRILTALVGIQLFMLHFSLQEVPGEASNYNMSEIDD
ncbi:hypothetical protein DCAR_0624373 [Daucus carota subsp. sativus]|uniref:Uncharacterized protein n=1 Tax=Daucus carota subsp. sativus TaxID=79200 RepID=A0AAF0XAZ6_DAUCS|nr:hypothetical protein DCAR_0624373 [Daucus carota subsp. sativus]